MRKRKKFLSLLLSTAMLVGIIPIGGLESVYADEAVEKQAQSIADDLEILDADNVLGNITLPDTDVEGAVVTWESSDDTVVSDTEKVNDDYDNMPAGVVTRGAADQKVTMTATVEYKGEVGTKDIELTVKAAKAQEDYAGYLFTFFPNNSDERVYFATSKDGMNFKDLNDESPILESTVGTEGLRDPYLIRSNEGDRFWLIGTDLSIGTSNKSVGWGDAQYRGSLSLVVWESTDLVNWSEPRLVDTGIRNVGCVWAPEAIYDEKTGEYVVFWASMTTFEDNSHQVMYYAKTRDFVTFTEPKEYIDRGKQEEYASIQAPHCIDLSMVKAGDSYYRVSADGEITIEKSDSVLGDWKIISTLKSLSENMEGYAAFKNETGIVMTGGVLEGPELFKFNGGDKWGLYSDNYGKIGYVPVTTTDLSDTTGTAWKTYTKDQYNFGTLLKRHGCITPITQTEYDAVMAKWGTDAEENTEAEQNEPVLEYTFDETLSGTTIADDSGNNYNGTLYGNATYVTDTKKGQVLYLDGTASTYAQLPTGFFDGRNKMTISMDVKAESVTGNYFTFTLGKSNKKYMFLKPSDTSTRFSMTTNSYGSEETLKASTDSIVGKWVNYKMVVDGATVSLYIDNVLAAQRTDTKMRTVDIGKDVLSYLGKSFYSGDAYFKGYFDNVKVYNRALSETEIAEDAGIKLDLLKNISSKDVSIVKQEIDQINRKVTLYATNFAYDLSSMTSKKADLKHIALDFSVVEGSTVTAAESYDLTKDFAVTINRGAESSTYTVSTVICNNPVLGGEFADPDIDAFNGKYYLYCTTDGFSGWGGYEFHVFESEDLTNWEDKGIILNLKTDVPWANGNAWAPSIEEKNGKYYFYFCGNETATNKKAIGVAVADSPTGPFVAGAEPVVNMALCGSEGISMGQAIDPSVFTEDDGTSYLLFGNGNPAIVQLDDTMTGIVSGTMKNYTGATDFREAITVNKVDGKYHFTWSCDDTGSENYHVNYGVSDSLYGPITYKYQLWAKNLANNIKGPAHHSILQIPGTKDFYIAYHRFLIPLGQVTSGYGYHRETCIDKLGYNEETQLFEAGTPTLEGVKEGQTYTLVEIVRHKVNYLAGEGGSIQGNTSQTVKEGSSTTTVCAVPLPGYRFKQWNDGYKDAERKDAALTDDLTVTAEFEKMTKADYAVYKDHLVGYLNFDSEKDGFQTEAVTGTAKGKVSLEDGYSGKALSLSGNGYVDVKKADGSSLLTGLDEFTISYYSKVESNGTNWAVFAAPDAQAPKYLNEVYFGVLDNSNGLTVERYKNTGSRPVNAKTTDTNTEWKHVVIVVEKDQTMLYIDGVRKAAVESSYLMSDILGENSIFQIGKGNWESGEYMTGFIDEFKVYDCALSMEQVISEGTKEHEDAGNGDQKNDSNTSDDNKKEPDNSQSGSENTNNNTNGSGTTDAGNGNAAQTSQVTVPTKNMLTADNPGLPTGTAEESKKSIFGELKAMVKPGKAASNKLQWSKIADADGYVVFGSMCNTKKKKYTYEVLTIIDGNSKTSYTHTGLAKGTYYKYLVQAYKMVDGKAQIISTSKTIHASTKNAKTVNVKKVKVNKTKVTLQKKGKTFKLKATAIKTSKKKMAEHRKLMYESSNSKIATVNSKGVIKAKKKGICTIYVYAQNGVYAKVTVKVKK